MVRRTPSEYDWSKQEFDERILTKHITSPRRSKVAFIVAHHMTVLGDGKGKANDACYSIWQTREASAHYGVDGSHVMQFVWDNNAAWATANTTGNHAGISIEHANSTIGPKWEISETTWKTGAKLAAYLHVTHKLGRPVAGTTLRRHSDFFATSCPGPFMASIWNKYVKEAQRVYDSITKPTPTPKPNPPKPVPTPPAGPVVYSSSLNAGSYNATGAKTYKSRVDKYAKRRLASNLDVLNMQEVGNGINRKGKPNARMRSRLDAKIGKVYRRHAGSDGRYCYSNRTRVKPIKSDVITAAKSTWYRGDDKQASYVVYDKDGVRAMDVSFHLENEDGPIADAKRVEQMLSILAQALVIAKAQRVDIRNILFTGDTNSEGMVARAMLAAGWRNVATGGPFENAATFIGWDGKARKRFDYAFVHQTAGPASLHALHADPEIGDHAELVTKRELTK